MPVVNISSPPESHGVGSSSSEMWTQRTGFDNDFAPAAACSSSSSRRLWTVSIALLAAHPLRRGVQHVVQHLADLLELLRVGDQRRRQLHDRVPAVVGAADQPAPEELAREEAAQQILGLLV